MIDSYIRNQSPYLQGSIVQADQKALFLITGIGLLLGYLESQQSLLPQVGALGQLNAWDVFIIGIRLSAAGFLFVGGCCCGFIVWPRYALNAARGSSSFVEIASAFSDTSDFAENQLACGDEELLRRQLKLHHYRCRVCLQKWHLLKWAYGLSATGVAIFMLHVVLAALQK